jgi:signal transduction histidine kinase
MKPDLTTIRSVQRRLFVLLLRAFTTVVLLTLVFIFAATAFFLSFSSAYNPFDRLPLITRLETYYVVRGSWDSVETVFQSQPFSLEETHLWKSAIFLDNDGQILAYKGDFQDPMVGQTYISSARDAVLPLTVNNHEIGRLVLPPSFLPVRGRFALALLAPVGFVSIFLAILTILIGLLLLRRVVVPLSQVIAAARAVASGDLSARVPVSGPDDLRALSDTFNHMAAALELSDRERRDLLADIAHELRTPLTVIRGRLEGVVDGIYPPDEKQIVPALEETYLLERLVEDLRLLTMAETRQLQFEPRDVSLGDLAEHALGLFGAEADESSISLELTNNAPGTQIHVDPQRTEQVIGNLIGNTLRYVPNGGKIWLVLEQLEDAVSLQVNDNGPGVPEEDLPHLFERFWRGEKSRSRSSGGAGLGLAIVRQLVETQGGRITAENLSAGGLRVSITFPSVNPDTI